MLYLFAGIFGFAFGGLWTLPTLAVAEIFGLRAHSTILGFVAFIGLMGESLGPVLAGYIFDVTGSYQLVFSICTIVSTISIIFVLLLNPIISEQNAR